MLLFVTFNYVSQSHHTTSRLEHCIKLEQVNPLFLKCIIIIYSIVCSDHMPLCIEMECDIVPICNRTFTKEPRNVCK